MTKIAVRLVTSGAIVAALYAAPVAHAEEATADFDVRIEIQGICSVTAGAGSDIDLGAVTSDQTNLAGSSDFTVNCSNSVPYYIGLAPSNGDTTGAGEMTPAGASTDTVPYQLRQTSGAAGTIWGDTATTTAAGNGVGSTGTGTDQTHTVFVTVPSANYQPDSYSDTVTITVNY